MRIDFRASFWYYGSMSDRRVITMEGRVAKKRVERSGDSRLVYVLHERWQNLPPNQAETDLQGIPQDDFHKAGFRRLTTVRIGDRRIGPQGDPPQAS